jgi:hypothetical protein
MKKRIVLPILVVLLMAAYFMPKFAKPSVVYDLEGLYRTTNLIIKHPSDKPGFFSAIKESISAIESKPLKTKFAWETIVMWLWSLGFGLLMVRNYNPKKLLPEEQLSLLSFQLFIMIPFALSSLFGAAIGGGMLKLFVCAGSLSWLIIIAMSFTKNFSCLLVELFFGLLPCGYFLTIGILTANYYPLFKCLLCLFVGIGLQYYIKKQKLIVAN